MIASNITVKSLSETFAQVEITGTDGRIYIGTAMSTNSGRWVVTLGGATAKRPSKRQVLADSVEDAARKVFAKM